VSKFAKLFLFLIFLISGCTDQKPSETIRFGLTTDPVTLDPRFATDAVSDRINRLIYSRLVDFDENFQVVPVLARWEKLNPKQYRFTLGDRSRTFHDGKKLTSKDVRVSYESILDSKTASPHRSSLNMIERIETPDSETIDFYLNRPDPQFPGRLTLGVMPAHLLEKDHLFNQFPVGSGPMKIRAWPQSGELSLQRLSDQQIIKFITVKDPTVRVLKLVRGELDLFQGDIPQEMINWLEKQAEIKIIRGRGSIFSYLGFNMQDPVVGQVRVRQAIAYALDRAAIIKYVFKKTARKANAILTPEHWAGAPDLQGYDHDREQAIRRLTELGYDNMHPLKIVYKTSNNPFRIRLATVIQHQLKQVGIELVIQSYDWGTFYGDIKAGNFQMYSLSWVGLKLPDIFRYVFHSNSVPPEGANRGRYSDHEIDRLIEKAEAEPNNDKQARYYRDIQQRLLDQLPYVPLWYEDNVLVMRKNLRGYKLAIDGNYDGLLKVTKNVKTD